ncbi:GspE/PulE family protein [Clostridium sp. CTA-19]
MEKKFAENIDVEDSGMKVISKETALNYIMMPYKLDNDNIYLFVSNFLDEETVEEIEFVSLRNVKQNILDKKTILYLINRHYEKEKLKYNIKKLESEKHKEEDKSQILTANEEDKSPAVLILDAVIKEAIEKKASDIHIEPRKNTVGIRIRINGDLVKVEEFPLEIYENIIYRIKILSSLDISQKLKPQDGKMKFIYEDKELDLRVSSLPTIYGEKIVIRILYANSNLYSLDELEFLKQDKKLIKKLLKSQNGMILLTGPTGSGKTTTLYAMVMSMDRERKNIVTVENPVEYEIEKANQVNINPNVGLNFTRSLSSILRQDPDVIMVGEIIDEKAAQIAITASLTGHLILSTMHCNDAPSSIIRLIDMKVPKYLVIDSLVLIISQRLVKTLCDNCKKIHTTTKEEMIDLNLDEPKNIFKPDGCECCNYTGYVGRKMVYEMVLLEDKHKQLIMNYEDINELRKYTFNNKENSLSQKLKNLVLLGLTSYDEYIANLQLNCISKDEVNEV